MIIRRNVPLALNQHIRMISEGSCNTKDWSNVCWKFTGINDIFTFYNKIEHIIKLQLYT